MQEFRPLCSIQIDPSYFNFRKCTLFSETIGARFEFEPIYFLRSSPPKLVELVISVQLWHLWTNNFYAFLSFYPSYTRPPICWVLWNPSTSWSNTQVAEMASREQCFWGPTRVVILSVCFQNSALVESVKLSNTQRDKNIQQLLGDVAALTAARVGQEKRLSANSERLNQVSHSRFVEIRWPHGS